MTNATEDGIGAIASRIDAQTAVMIAMFCDYGYRDPEKYIDKYTTMYDVFAAEYRKHILVKRVE